MEYFFWAGRSLEKYFVSITRRNYVDNIETETFYGDFLVKLMWRLFGNLIYHVFSMKTPGNLRTNFTIKPP